MATVHKSNRVWLRSHLSARLSILCVSSILLFFCHHFDLQQQIQISLLSPSTSGKDFKLWENYQTEAKTLPPGLISQFTLCFASSGLFVAEERSLARTNFKVFTVKLITSKNNKKRRIIWRAVLAVHSIYPWGKSVPYPEASFCFPPPQWGRKTLIIHCVSLTKRGGKQSQGIRFRFSTHGNAEQRKMRWTVMERKAENVQQLQHIWQETRNTTRLGIKLPETENAKDRPPTSRIMLTLVVVVRCEYECAHELSVHIWGVIHKRLVFLKFLCPKQHWNSCYFLRHVQFLSWSQS